MGTRRLTTPIDKATVAKLKAGDQVLISGDIYTARDAAHKKMASLLSSKKKLPFNIKGAVIYYVGPTPSRPGNPIGSAGPTTSGRMDPYTPRLISLGLKGIIGKGKRSPEVIAALKKYKAVYLAACGGAAALLAGKVLEKKLIAFPELEPESIYRLTVQDFPAVVVNDVKGKDLYEKQNRKTRE